MKGPRLVGIFVTTVKTKIFKSLRLDKLSSRRGCIKHIAITLMNSFSIASLLTLYFVYNSRERSYKIATVAQLKVLLLLSFSFIHANKH